MLGYAGWYTLDIYRNILFYLPLQQLFLIGPFIYLYTKSLSDPSFALEKKDVVHFIPALLYNAGMLVVFLNDQVLTTDYFFYADEKDMDLDPWYQWAGWFSMVCYLILSIRYYSTYQKTVYDAISFAEELLFRWIQHILFVFLGILFLRMLFFILNPEWGEFGRKFWYYLSFGILFNYIAFRGYLHSIQVEASQQAALFDRAQISSTFREINTTSQKQIESEIKDLPVLLERLEAYMQDQAAYENPTLTIAELANHLQTHSKAVSTIINSQFEMNFNDWVNKYRIEAVLQRFKQGQHKEQTILSVALDSGFNSKSTFNRAFKKHTGTTPIQFLKNHAEK